jgi:hypothetical protein
LEIGEVILATVLSRHNMVNFNGAFVCRNTAQFAPETRALQNLVTETA